MFGHQCIKRHLYCRSLCHQTYWPSLQEVSKFERDGNFVINLFCAKNVVSQPMSQDGDRILRFGGQWVNWTQRWQPVSILVWHFFGSCIWGINRSLEKKVWIVLYTSVFGVRGAWWCFVGYVESVHRGIKFHTIFNTWGSTPSHLARRGA